MKTFLPKSGIFTVVFLIANLFFICNAFGQDTGLLPPTTSASISSVTNVGNGLASDNAYAVFDSGSDVGDYGGFDFSSIPAGSTILGIEVQLEGNRANSRNFNVQLTWNNKTSFTTAKAMAAFGGTDALRTVGSPTDTWGHTWAISEFTNANFFIRLSTAAATGNLNLDQIMVKVYYCLQPTITTIGTATAVCFSTSSQTTTLPYTATTNNPTSYSITWTGISNQGSTAFAFSPGGGEITGITIPASTLAGTYNGTLTITNAGGCSATNPISVIVNAGPIANAGTALTAICQGGTSVALGGSVGGSATGGTWSDGGIGGLFTPNDTDLNATWTPPSGYSGTAILTLTTSGGVCGTTTASKSQTVNAQPTAAAGGSQTICSNQTATISGTATNGTIVWTVGGGINTGTLDNPNIESPVFTPDQYFEGTATLTMTVSNGVCTPATATYSVIVNGGAATVDPGIDVTICMTTPGQVPLSGLIGGSASSGTWSGGNGQFLPNNTDMATSYTPTQDEIDFGSVTLTLTSEDPGGPCSGAVSKSKTITFKKAPTATAGGSTSVCPGSSAIVSGATATNGTIVWTHNGSGSLTNADTLTPTYTSVVGEAGSTVTLTLTVSNLPCPNETATYTVIVNPLPDSKNLLGTKTICSGISTDIQVIDSQYDFGLGIQYQLRNNANNAAVGNAVSGTGTTIDLPTGILTNTTANPITFTFNVLATNLDTNCFVQMANLITITVNPAPLNRTITGPAGAICTGSAQTITVGTASASVNGTTYQLRNNADNSNIVGSTNTISNTSTASFGLSTLALTTTTTFNVLATIDATGCTAQMTGTPTVTVNQLISDNTITSDQSICTGTAPAGLIGSTHTGGNVTYTYLWEQSTNNGTGTGTWAGASITNGASSRTLINYTPPQSPPSTVTTWYRRTVTSTPCSPNISNVVKITVNPLPTVYAVTGGGAYCDGGAGMPIGLSNSQTDVNYQLLLDGVPDGLPVAGTTGSTITFGNKTVAGTYTVRANDAVTNCPSNMTGSATIIINPVPVTTGTSVCLGENGGVLTSSCPNPTVIVGPINSGTGTSATGTGTAWTNPNNIVTDNSTYATASTTAFGGSIVTNSLQATNFDFLAIPNSATILGIQVSIKRFSNANTPSDYVQDNIVSLVKGGVVTGSNYADTATNWSITNTTVVSYGGPSDMWGTTWTAAEIKATNFGVALTAFVNKSGFNANTASVDNMRIKVYYLANGILNWYTASSGGTLIGTGSPFNPVGVLDSGLPDTNTPGTTTFYAECTSVPGCRTATDFVVHPLPTLTCPADSTVCINTTSYALTGSSPLGGTYSGDGVTSNNFDPTTAGLGPHIITYTYTDGNGCSNSCTFTITVNSTVVASGTQVDVICRGESTGSIELTVTGGSDSYSYLWSPGGETTKDISGLAAGDYSVVITETNGCATTGTTSFTITEPEEVFASGTQVDVLCKGASTGSIDLTVTGGSDTYTYEWSNGATTQDISGLAAGDYSVIISENTSCTASVITKNFTIGEPAEIVAAIITEQINVDCFGNNTGSATVTASGGISPYTYLWDNPSTQTTATATNLSQGTYKVTVTDANGCSTEATVTITQPNELTASITNQIDIDCPGYNTGSATVTATGGTSPYTYSWDNGATSDTASSLTNGDYIVTVTDANGCIAHATAHIIAVDNIDPTVITQDIDAYLDATGNAVITVVQIDNGSSDNCAIQSRTLSKSSFTCADFGPQTVTLTVTDTNGNIGTGDAIVTVKDAIKPVINGMPANRTVNLSGNNCSALVTWIAPTATDNCGVYSLISDDDTYNQNGSALLTTGNNLITYTATDVNGNIETASFTITVVDNTKPTISNCPVNITKNTDNNICGARVTYIQPTVSDCNGATLSINNESYLSGNIFPVGTTTVTWTATDPAGNQSVPCSFTVTVNDNQAPVPNIASLPTITGECSVTVTTPTALDNCKGTINGIPDGPTTYSSTGTYTIIWTYTDDYGNSSSQSQNVNVTATPPVINTQPISLTKCEGQSATFSVSSASAIGYQWQLYDGSDWNDLATETNSTLNIASVTSSMNGNNYRVNVIGSCGSTPSDAVILTVYSIPIVTDQLDQSLCNNSTFTMTQTVPSVGTGVWTLISGTATITDLNSPTTTITGVLVGTSARVRWTVTNGTCSAYDEVKVTNTILPSVSNQLDQSLCSTSTFTMTQSAPSAGTGIWTLISPIGTGNITTPSSPTTTITDVAVGTSATVRWTVTNGTCSSYDEVIVTNTTMPTVTPQNDQNECNTTSFTMTQTGSGTWSKISGPGTITTPSSPTTTITGVTAGSSTVLRWTVGSGNCTASDDVTVTNNNGTPFTATISASGLTLTANPSIAGTYTYLWSPGGAITQSITLTSSTPATTYTVTLTKTDGCNSTAQATYNYQPQNNSSNNDYTIVGFTDVNLSDKNFVQTGSVGVTKPLGMAFIGTNNRVDGPGAFVKARFITVGSNSNVPVRIYSPATLVLPTMQVNSTSTTGLPDLNIANNTTVTKVGNFKNVTIGTNCNVTFTTGTIFGTVTIGKSSQVKFNANGTGILNVQSLSLADGTDAAPSKLTFGSDVSIRVKNTAKIGKSSMVNLIGGYKAVFYIGGTGFNVSPGGNTTVNASVFAPNGTIKVEGDAAKSTYMYGSYIGSRVTSSNKNIYWNLYFQSAKTNDEKAINSITEELPLVTPDKGIFDIKIYPNPSSYQFTIEIRGGSDETVEIDIFDMQGRKIKHIENGINLPIIFGEDLPAGTYIAIVKQGPNQKTLKLIKK